MRLKRETRNIHPIHGIFEGSEKRMIERQGARGHCLSWLKASAILYGCSVGCLALRTFPGIRLPFTSRRSIILRFRRMKNTEIAATTSFFRDPPLSIVQHNSTRKERFFFWNFPIPREIPCFPSISALSPIYTVDIRGEKILLSKGN